MSNIKTWFSVSLITSWNSSVKDPAVRITTLRSHITMPIPITNLYSFRLILKLSGLLYISGISRSFMYVCIVGSVEVIHTNCVLVQCYKYLNTLSTIVWTTPDIIEVWAKRNKSLWMNVPVVSITKCGFNRCSKSSADMFKQLTVHWVKAEKSLDDTV